MFVKTIKIKKKKEKKKPSDNIELTNLKLICFAA